MNPADRLLTALVLIFAVWVATASGTLAGDRALLNVIGYSSDAHYFAFEEFGVHDGSGGAYSHIYVVDLTTDSFVKDSPFEVESNDDSGPPMGVVRAEVAKKAAATLARLKIDTPAETWVQLGDAVPKADGKSMSWSIPNCCGPGSTEDDLYKLDLSTIKLDNPNDCASTYGGDVFGFALSYTAAGQTTELHRDASLPKSRGCTVDYRLYAVVSPLEGSDGRVAIISSYPFGFEGPDRRFLAIPLGD